MIPGRSRRPGPFRLGRFLPDQLEERHGDSLLSGWRKRISTAGVLCVALFTIAVLIPDMLGMRTISTRVGTLPTRPIYSRVNFHWATQKEREAVELQVRERFARYYVEQPRWAETVSLEAEKTLQIIFEAMDDGAWTDARRDSIIAQVLDRATERKLALSRADAEVLVDGVQAFRKSSPRGGLHEHLFLPTRLIINSTIGVIGVMGESAFLNERGRAVRIVKVDGQVHLIPRVGDPGNIIPLGMASPRLEQTVTDFLRGWPKGFLSRWAALVGGGFVPNLSIDADRNQAELVEAIQKELETTSLIAENTIIARAGRFVDAETFDRIRTEQSAYEQTYGVEGRMLRIFGRSVLLFAAGIGFILYGVRLERHTHQHEMRLCTIVGMAVCLLILLRVGIAWGGMWVSLMPMGLLAGLAALIFGPRMGLACGSLFSFGAFVLTGADVGESVALLGSSWLFAALTPGLRFRLSLLRAGFAAGVASFLFLACWDVSGGETMQSLLFLRGAYSAFVWLMGGVFLTVILPVVERFFSCATNITLLELSDQNHPCLRRLIIEAPGTYHHSIVVGNLAEAAAEAIGANALLARVGSYYHDIGKVLKPDYFSENDSGQSRHEMLTPTMSTLVILAHVKDGVELGRYYNLPQNIIDVIAEHHGTSLVQYFYQRAKEQGANVDESAFRYDGPNPRSQEAAIVLLADSIEAASRTLTEPTPAHIERMIHRIIMAKMTDHQLDDATLTFREISVIEKSFCRTLNAMFHTRIRYPDADTRQGRKRS